MTVGFEDVAAAATELKEEGGEPTTRNVQAKLGGKSHSYIAAYTGLWKRREERLEEASDLPDAFLDEARLLAHGLWSIARDRADIRQELHLREIERLRSEAEQRETSKLADDAELRKKATDVQAKITCFIAEIEDLKQQLTSEKERNGEARVALEEAEAQRDKAEARFRTYSSIVQSDQTLDRVQSDAAIARAAQLEFENEELRQKAQDAEARRQEEAERFDSLLRRFIDQVGKSPTRKSRVTKAASTETGS